MASALKIVAGQVWYFNDADPVLTCGVDDKEVHYLPVQCAPKTTNKGGMENESMYLKQDMSQLMQTLETKGIQCKMDQMDFVRKYKYRSRGPHIHQVWKKIAPRYLQESKTKDGKEINLVNPDREVVIKGFTYVRDLSKYNLWVDFGDMKIEDLHYSMPVMKFKNAYECQQKLMF